MVPETGRDVDVAVEPTGMFEGGRLARGSSALRLDYSPRTENQRLLRCTVYYSSAVRRHAGRA